MLVEGDEVVEAVEVIVTVDVVFTGLGVLIIVLTEVLVSVEVVGGRIVVEVFVDGFPGWSRYA